MPTSHIDVSDTFTVAVEAAAETVREALERLELTDSSTLAVEAFDTPGQVTVTWELRVRPSAAEGSFLSITTRFRATDDRTRARLLADWRVIGPLSTGLSKRTLATVKAYAEEQDEPAAAGSIPTTAVEIPIRRRHLGATLAGRERGLPAVAAA